MYAYSGGITNLTIGAICTAIANTGLRLGIGIGLGRWWWALLITVQFGRCQALASACLIIVLIVQVDRKATCLLDCYTAITLQFDSTARKTAAGRGRTTAILVAFLTKTAVVLTVTR